MVKRSAPTKRKRRKPARRAALPTAHGPEAAAIDALFDAFAHNLARKLAAKAQRARPSLPVQGETR